MRLHEALKNLNVGLDTVADFLFWKGMPLEDRSLNVRLRDEQCSLLFKEFGYKQKGKTQRSYEANENPDVQVVLNEIHQKHSSSTAKQPAIGSKSYKKAQRKIQGAQRLDQLKGQKVMVKIKWFHKQILYTKGFMDLFTDGYVQLSDVFYDGNRLNVYWAEFLLKTCKVKTEFTVLDSQVKIEGDNKTYARLRFVPNYNSL